MDFNKKILDKIDNLVKLSSEFDSGFKIIFNLETNKINEKEADILYSMTKNYILIRKEHGIILLMYNEILLMHNKKLNLVDYDEYVNTAKQTNKNTTKNAKKSANDVEKMESMRTLYDISTFNTLISNINDLINNVDYEYKKIAIKFPKFINKSQMKLILITSSKTDEKYTNMFEELKTEHPEHKYHIVKCGDEKSDMEKCEKELADFNIKIKSLKSLPLIYIVNGTIITEIPIEKIGTIEPIKKLIE
jgi:hypothetical protein